MPSRPATSAVRGQSSPSNHPTGCEVGALFSMLAQPYMLHILQVFLGGSAGPVRFGEVQTRLALSPKTLSRRLKTLVEAGLLVRRQYNEIPPRVDYQATEKAQRLGALFRAMEEWASQNTLSAVRTVSVVGRA